jgi:putative cardiolipin synthase
MKRLKILVLSTAVLAVSSCAQLPKDYELERTTAVTNTEQTALGLQSTAVRWEYPEKSRLVLLHEGVDAFYARATLAKLAERSLDLQYFLWHKDLTGQVLLKLVLDAADRGVRVRLLLDDLDNQDLDPELYALDTHENVSVRLFNPFATRDFKYVDFFVDTARINRRMHNKSFTADNQYTIVGGRNIGDEYFDAGEGFNFYDMDVLATGPVVADVSSEFDLYWNHEAAVPIGAFEQNTATTDDLENLRRRLTEYRDANLDSPYADDLRSSRVAAALNGGEFPAYAADATVIFDDPDKGLGKSPDEFDSMADLMKPYFDKVKREVVLISPYFVPGDGGVNSLGALVKRGVDVHVITNSYASTDSAFVHAGYSAYREALLAAGVHLYELNPSAQGGRREGSVVYDSLAGLHAKFFILDVETVFIGSLNLDPRSIDINTEMGILVYSPELAWTWGTRLEDKGLQQLYELELVRSPAESGGEFTVYTNHIEWIERTNGETIRHATEPGVGASDSIKLFFSNMAPESQI